jgi:hypothetical protein
LSVTRPPLFSADNAPGPLPASHRLPVGPRPPPLSAAAWCPPQQGRVQRLSSPPTSGPSQSLELELPHRILLKHHRRPPLFGELHPRSTPFSDSRHLTLLVANPCYRAPSLSSRATRARQKPLPASSSPIPYSAPPPLTAGAPPPHLAAPIRPSHRRQPRHGRRIARGDHNRRCVAFWPICHGRPQGLQPWAGIGPSLFMPFFYFQKSIFV